MIKKFREKEKIQSKLKKLSKELKDKRVIVYGAGLFSQLIFDNCDLSGINIVGVADRDFFYGAVDDQYYSSWLKPEFKGYKAISTALIPKLKPDAILIFTKETYLIKKSLKARGLVDFKKVKVIDIINTSFKSKLMDFLNNSYI